MQPTTSYAYKASLIGSAHQFELTDYRIVVADRRPVRGLALCRYRFDPSVLSAGRRCSPAAFVPTSKSKDGGRIAVLSTTWQTVSLMAPQDHGYRAFITELHRRMQKAGSTAALFGGIGPKTYATAVLRAGVARHRHGGLLVRALFTGELMGALFLVGFAACSPGRSAASSSATGRGATASTICRKDCCRSLFVATKRNETWSTGRARRGRFGRRILAPHAQRMGQDRAVQGEGFIAEWPESKRAIGSSIRSYRHLLSPSAFPRACAAPDRAVRWWGRRAPGGRRWAHGRALPRRWSRGSARCRAGPRRRRMSASANAGGSVSQRW